MKWNVQSPPKAHNPRTQSGFLFWPIIGINCRTGRSESRWLCFAKWEQWRQKHRIGDSYSWGIKYWIDD